MQNLKKVQNAAAFVRNSVGLEAFGPAPSLGLVLGTGLGAVAEAMREHAAVDYADIPGFPPATVASHAGRLVLGTLADTPVWVLQGRFHLYEGNTAGDAVLGVRTLATLGVKALVLTNAAGALNPLFDAGHVMLVTDHLNMTGASPLTGANVDAWGERFPDMTGVYARRLRDLAQAKAAALGIRLERGVYCQVPGPQIETPAETRAYKRLGADAIGMSTAIEAIAARHMGLDVLALSALANKNLPDQMDEVTFEDVLATVARAGGDMARLLAAVLPEMARGRVIACGPEGCAPAEG